MSREHRSETTDLSIVDPEQSPGDRNPFAVRYTDFSVWDEPNQLFQGDAEKEQLVRDSYKSFYELPTQITNAISVNGVILLGAQDTRADRFRRFLNEDLQCDVKEVIETSREERVVLRFANVAQSAAFMRFVEGKIGSGDRENCSFRSDPKETEDNLDRWKKVYVKEKGMTETLLLVFVGVRFNVACVEGRKTSYVVTEIVFQCGNRVQSHKLDPVSNDVVVPGKEKAKDKSKSMAYLSNFLKELNMKLMSSGYNGCLFFFAAPAAARAFIKWAEALQMLPELCKYVSHIGFNKKTNESRKFIKDFPNENSVVETSIVLGTRMLDMFMKVIAKNFKSRVLSSCLSTSGIEKKFAEVWGSGGKVAFVDLRFIAGPSADGDPVLIQIGLSIHNDHADHDQLFCCFPTETTKSPADFDGDFAETLSSLTPGQATFSPSEADMLGEFISHLADAHTTVVLCTASDYFGLSLLVGKVYRHGLESAFLDVVTGHFDLATAASEAFLEAELSGETRCGIASPASVWETVFPETENPWAGEPRSSPPAHISARNLGKLVRATVPDLTAFTRRRARAMDELKLGGGDAAVELRIALSARTIQPRSNIQLTVPLRRRQEKAVEPGQCVVFPPRRRKGQVSLTDFKICESTDSKSKDSKKAISYLATNCTEEILKLRDNELLGVVRAKPGSGCVAPHNLYRKTLEPETIYDVNLAVETLPVAFDSRFTLFCEGAESENQKTLKKNTKLGEDEYQYLFLALRVEKGVEGIDQICLVDANNGRTVFDYDKRRESAVRLRNTETSKQRAAAASAAVAKSRLKLRLAFDSVVDQGLPKVIICHNLPEVLPVLRKARLNLDNVAGFSSLQWCLPLKAIKVQFIWCSCTCAYM